MTVPDPASWLNLPSTVRHVVPFPLQTPQISSSAPDPILWSHPTSWCIKDVFKIKLEGMRGEGCRLLRPTEFRLLFYAIIEYIYVICRLGGPYSEKLWPRSWKCCPRPAASGSIFKTEVTVFHYTDRPKPVNNLFIFFLSLKRLCLLTGKNLRKRYCDRSQR